MRLLILGGTLFLGRHLVDAALAAGHETTTFTRRSKPHDSRVEALHGDRDGDLAALEGREWDAVIDTSGYVPRVVGASVDLLAPRVGHYTFVSSINAYADLRGTVTEDSPAAELEDAASEDLQAHYGPLKVACERRVTAAFGSRALIVRPGLIVGPHDPTGRFTYWVQRLARGGEVLAPGDPGRRVQLVDARDLATWHIALAERGASGSYNATGPVPRPSMAEMLEAIDPAAELTWVDDAFLLEHEVGEWLELPLWLVDPDSQGMLDADVSKAVAAGLRFRPLAETARDTLAWARTAGPPPPKSGVQLGAVGMAPEREAELLAAWHARESA
jgi:2'-hydroxyisoflavone reductase